VTLSEAEVDALEAITVDGGVSGERYSEASMKRVNL
jgi:hypothetical protein